jgi:hypothetical protein
MIDRHDKERGHLLSKYSQIKEKEKEKENTPCSLGLGNFTSFELHYPNQIKTK